MPRRPALPFGLLPILLLALGACSPSAEPGLGEAVALAVAVASPARSDPAPEEAALPTIEVATPVALPPEMWATLQEARSHHRNGDLEAALRAYRRIVTAGPAPAEARLELAQVELAGGDPASARETLRELPASDSPGPLRARAQLLLATAELALGDREAALRHLQVEATPDGLADLVLLRRAEARAGSGDLEGVRADLGRPEMRDSTNRLILELAGRLAERAGDPGLAGELYARGAGYFGWSAERSRVLQAAGAAFARAGRREEAIQQYLSLVEGYPWTGAGQEAGVELERLGGLTPFHRGLLALSARRDEAARAAFAEAAAGGEYARAASGQLRRMEETAAWRAADDVGTAEAYRSFRSLYPDGAFAAEARFQEGLVHYQAGRVSAALAVWEGGAAGAAGDHRARLLLWAGKALARLGDEAAARSRWESAAGVRPAGYYAVRARDLLVGVEGWPAGGRLPDTSREEELAEAEGWLQSWARPGRTADAREVPRARRGLGLLALGLVAEAEVELNGLIAESQNGPFLYRLAGQLAERELWVSASRAAARVVALSPAGSVAEAPRALQRLVYPPAFPDLVGPEAERQGLDPLLLLALIHQESRYDPFALSVAEARGLTQVIPSTGRGIAAALGRRGFAPEDLYRPAVAVQFGGWYLADRLATFRGDPFRALAAYNAGGGPIARWAAPDPDLFVERIDYSETRSYVRQIYLHHALYRGLSGSSG